MWWNYIQTFRPSFYIFRIIYLDHFDKFFTSLSHLTLREWNFQTISFLIIILQIGPAVLFRIYLPLTSQLFGCNFDLSDWYFFNLMLAFFLCRFLLALPSLILLVALSVREVVHWVPTEELPILEPCVDWNYCYRDPC